MLTYWHENMDDYAIEGTFLWLEVDRLILIQLLDLF